MFTLGVSSLMLAVVEGWGGAQVIPKCDVGVFQHSYSILVVLLRVPE